MSDRPSVFLTGATGYVGASYLQSLLALPSPHTPRLVTCLVRSPQKAEILNTLSNEKTAIKAVVGDFGKADLLSRLSEEHDVTVESAVSDSLEMMTALLEGMRRRKETGLETVFVHVSGTGTLVDDAGGEYAGEVVRGPLNCPLSALSAEREGRGIRTVRRTRLWYCRSTPSRRQPGIVSSTWRSSKPMRKGGAGATSPFPAPSSAWARAWCTKRASGTRPRIRCQG